MVLVEILSDPLLPKKFVDEIGGLPLLEITENYWQRAGINSSKLISKKLKARLADTLIAQSCIDHQILSLQEMSILSIFLNTAGYYCFDDKNFILILLI